MTLHYAKLFNHRVTPQSRPIPGSTQVANSGGGYSWQVDDWTRLDRFLVLGAGSRMHITRRAEAKASARTLISQFGSTSSRNSSSPSRSCG